MSTNWEQHFEIVYEKFKEFAVNNKIDPRDTHRLGMAKFFGVSQGKMQAWQKGQWPSAPDLAVIAEKLGFSYRWLVTGEGDPFEEGGPPMAVHTPPAPVGEGSMAAGAERRAPSGAQMGEDEAALKRENDLLKNLIASKDEVIELQRRLLERADGERGRFTPTPACHATAASAPGARISTDASEHQAKKQR